MRSEWGLDKKSFTLYFDREVRDFREWTPEQKLDWLDKANEFVKTFALKEKPEEAKSN